MVFARASTSCAFSIRLCRSGRSRMRSPTRGTSTTWCSCKDHKAVMPDVGICFIFCVFYLLSWFWQQPCCPQAASYILRCALDLQSTFLGLWLYWSWCIARRRPCLGAWGEFVLEFVQMRRNSAYASSSGYSQPRTTCFSLRLDRTRRILQWSAQFSLQVHHWSWLRPSLLVLRFQRLLQRPWLLLWFQEIARVLPRVASLVRCLRRSWCGCSEPQCLLPPLHQSSLSCLKHIWVNYHSMTMNSIGKCVHSISRMLMPIVGISLFNLNSICNRMAVIAIFNLVLPNVGILEYQHEWFEFGELTSNDILRWVHDCPEWHHTLPRKVFWRTLDKFPVEYFHVGNVNTRAMVCLKEYVVILPKTTISHVYIQALELTTADPNVHIIRREGSLLLMTPLACESVRRCNDSSCSRKVLRNLCYQPISADHRLWPLLAFTLLFFVPDFGALVVAVATGPCCCCWSSAAVIISTFPVCSAMIDVVKTFVNISLEYTNDCCWERSQRMNLFHFCRTSAEKTSYSHLGYALHAIVNICIF